MSLYNLLSRFNNLEMQAGSAQTHNVQLNFPDCDLLPDRETIPSLEPPVCAAYMSRPPKDEAELGLRDLNFHISMTAQYALGLTADDGAHARLLIALDDLVHVAGTSKLDFVQFYDELLQQMVMRFRLTTTTLSDHSVIQTFMLTADETDMLFAVANNHVCIAMVQHMMARASYRAYYRVHRQLADHYGYDFVNKEEASWRLQWAARQQLEFKAAFVGRLTLPTPIPDYCTTDAVYCQLPCGHEMSTSVVEIASMSEQDCKTATCKQCGSTILSSLVVENVTVALESVKCNKLARFNAHWVKLDRNLATEFTYRFDGRTLYAALKASLKGFASSELVSPPSLCIAKHPSVARIMVYLRHKLIGGHQMIEEVPKTLLESLIEEVMENVRTDDGTRLTKSLLPPGYVRFLHDWMLRTINFVTDRQCNEPACDLGIHRHGPALAYKSVFDGVVCNGPDDTTHDDYGQEMPENDVHEDAMNFLMAEMGDMSLDGKQTLNAVMESMSL